MRRLIAVLLTLVMIMSYPAVSEAFTITYDGKVEDYPWDPIVLVVDGQTVKTEQMPPIILNGRTMVPAREFFEQIGAKVTWVQESKRVIIEYDNEKIVLTINSRTVYIGDNSATISPADPAPKIINDKTMIPVRFVAEEFGFDVQWVNDTRTVRITSPHTEEVNLTMVSFSQGEDVDTIFIGLDEFVNPNVFKMQDPARIVIDVYGARATIKDGSIVRDGCAVKSVRYSQHDDRFRVVADLTAVADFEVLKLKNGIEVSIIKTGEFNEEATEPETDNSGDIVVEEDATIPDYDGKLIVVVDPGHGGSDPGATYPVGVKDPDVREKDITLDVALKIKENLEKEGIIVIMTRDGDTYPTLKERVDMANSSGADLYVSVHCNAMDNKDEIDGAQVYYHASSEFGKKTASLVYDKIIEYTGMTKRGIQDGSSFYVLKNTTMPAILTEGGFITNEGDREYLSTENGRQAMADAISDGVLEALGVI